VIIKTVKMVRRFTGSVNKTK